jgi:hypothetical protein
MEPEEVVEEIASESGKPGWFGLLALTTIVLAVGATLASFKEGNNSVDSVLNQTQAANQWAYYQAKSIKSYLYEIEKEKLERELKMSRARLTPDIATEYETKIAEYKKDIERYAEEKKGIAKQAKEFEGQRDLAQRRAETFGLAVIFLQMGILLCSVAALMTRKSMWAAGVVVGAIGLVYFANGFVLFM